MARALPLVVAVAFVLIISGAAWFIMNPPTYPAGPKSTGLSAPANYTYPSGSGGSGGGPPPGNGSAPVTVATLSVVYLASFTDGTTQTLSSGNILVATVVPYVQGKQVSSLHFTPTITPLLGVQSVVVVVTVSGSGGACGAATWGLQRTYATPAANASIQVDTQTITASDQQIQACGSGSTLTVAYTTTITIFFVNGASKTWTVQYPSVSLSIQTAPSPPGGGGCGRNCIPITIVGFDNDMRVS